MKVAIFSRTPLAAAPWELWKALRRYTRLDVSLINVVTRYADGRTFPSHLVMNGAQGAAAQALAEADVWHVHNYLTADLQFLRRRHPVVAQFHSVPRLGNWSDLMRWATRCYTIRQPLQEAEYRLPTLPNIIDPDEYRPARRGRKLRIAFAPTNRIATGPSAKGYHDVRQTLDRVARQRDVDIVWIEGRPYEDNLRLKQGCHVLIDDVVTGNWHRTSLEGLCFGCVVLNRVQKQPFMYVTLATLEERLLYLADNMGTVCALGEISRLWVLRNWHAMDMVAEYEKAYREVVT